MFLDEGVSVAVGYVDVSNLINTMHLSVIGYSEPKTIAVTDGGLEISLDQENWTQEVEFDFASELRAELYIREGTSDYGTITVLNI